jgi:hypothetical protein
MATVFWDHKDVMLVDFTQHGTIINAGAYFTALERLRAAITLKCPGMFMKGVLLLHDNARRHSANVT